MGKNLDRYIAELLGLRAERERARIDDTVRSLYVWAKDAVCYWQTRHERAAAELANNRQKIKRLKLDIFRKDSAIREYKQDVERLGKAWAWTLQKAREKEAELQALRYGRVELEAQAQAAIDAYEAECSRLRDELVNADITLGYDETWMREQDEKIEGLQRAVEGARDIARAQMTRNFELTSDIAELKRKNQLLVSGYDAIGTGLLGVESAISEVIEAGGEF